MRLPKAQDVQSADSTLYAFTPDGTRKWSFTTSGVIESSPAIGVNRNIYVGSRDGRLYAVTPDGTLEWSYTTGGEVFSSPADGAVYVG